MIYADANVNQVSDSEARRIQAMDIARLGHWKLDLQSLEFITSPLCRANFGRDPGEPFSYEELVSAIHPDDRSRRAEVVSAAVEGRSPFEIQYRAVTPKGELRWIEVRGRFDRIEGRDHFVGVSQDITDLKQAEEKLRESESRYRSLINASNQVLYKHSADWTEMLQLSGSGFLADTNSPDTNWFNAYIHPDDQPEVWEQIQQAIRTKSASDFEHRVIRADGSLGWTLSRSVPILDKDGEIVEWFGAASDVTSRREAERLARQYAETFQTLIRNAPFGVYVIDADFRVAQASRKARQVFGIDPLIGSDLAMALRTIWAEPFAGEAIDRFRHTLSSGEPYVSSDIVEKRADRDAVEAYDWRLERIAMPDGRPGVVCYFYELTERHRLEQALREREEQLRHIVDSAKEYAIISLDIDGRIESWNSGAERLLGYSKEDAVGQSGNIFFTPEDRELGEEQREMRLAREEERAENKRWHIRKDGSRFWASGVMLPMGGGRIAKYLKIFRDQTAERLAEERQKLLINELNHRVKNTLATVQAIATQTFRRANVDENVRKSFELRLRGLAISHDVLTQERWAGARLIRIIAGALKPFAVGKHRVQMDGPSLYLAPKPALALGMVLHELATNATKYGALSNETGRIAVSWSMSEDDDPRLHFRWKKSVARLSCHRPERGLDRDYSSAVLPATSAQRCRSIIRLPASCVR